MLFITSGLALRSDWEELDEARGRRLRGKQQRTLKILVKIRIRIWAMNILNVDVPKLVLVLSFRIVFSMCR